MRGSKLKTGKWWREKLWKVLNLENEFTPRQEFVHSSLHALGLFWGLVWIPILLAQALETDNYRYFLSCLVYSFGFLTTFACSTIFHSVRRPKTKKIFKLLDYLSIYIFIAGTYTPLVVTYMNNQTGHNFLTAIWLLTFVGITTKLFLPRMRDLFSVLVYLSIGLMFLFVQESFFRAMSPFISRLIIAGVILYCIGVIFFLWRNWPHHHAVWHLFVLFAGLCHFAAILFSIKS